MADEPDYILDIPLLCDDAPTGEVAAARKDAARRWLGVQFECCGVYARIYRNRQGTAYIGHCPRCCRSVRIQIGPGGVSGRFFLAH